MLNLYRLHGPRCKKGYERLDRGGKNCNCPIHVEGKLGDEFIRKSTKTRSMEKARDMIEAAQESGVWSSSPDAVNGKPVQDAVREFLADAADPRGRHLSTPTLTKYRTLLGRLGEFADRRGLPLSAVDFGNLNEFKRTWPTGPLATAHNITRLRTFFGWCLKHRWIESNPAEELDMPPNLAVERMPYAPAEMQAILDAARTFKFDRQQTVSNRELETFILVMRWSGLGISDTALLQKTEVRGDEIRLYRKKTRQNAKRVLVVVPLPAEILDRLRELPLVQGRYYFAHGSDVLANQVEAWRKRLQFIFKAANIRNPGSHRFRHTFATDLLEKGVSIELVSRWLGHSSIKITQEHYSHFIESRIQAASDVLRRLYQDGGGRP